MFTNCFVSSGSSSIVLGGSGENLVSNCELRGNQANNASQMGVHITSPYNQINNCKITANNANGIETTSAATNTTISNNQIFCTGTSAASGSATGNILIGNRMVYTGTSGTWNVDTGNLIGM
jgi:hypothetical protein